MAEWENLLIPKWVLDFNNNYYVGFINDAGLNILQAGLSDDRFRGARRPTTGEGR
jgi:hypothetical protein